MKWFFACLGACAAILAGLWLHLQLGDSRVRTFCRELPHKLSSSEVRNLVDQAGLKSQQLPHLEMRVTAEPLWGLLHRDLSCRVVFNKELTVEFKIVEGS